MELCAISLSDWRGGDGPGWGQCSMKIVPNGLGVQLPMRLKDERINENVL